MDAPWTYPLFWPVLVPSVVGIGAVISLYRARRRFAKVTVCPADGQPREVRFAGSALDPLCWQDVTSCGRPGDAPLVGRALRCSKSCLADPANAPAVDLEELRV